MGRPTADARCSLAMAGTPMVEGPERDAILDKLVEESTDLDVFCSSSDWVVPAHAAFGQGDLRFRVDDPRSPASATALLAVAAKGGKKLFCGLDPIWSYARPVVGRDVERSLAFLVEDLEGHPGDWDVLALTGVQQGTPFQGAARQQLGARWTIGAQPGLTCQIVDLADGPDGFMARRSARFRKNLRQAGRRATDADIELRFVVGGGPEVVRRCREVERRSWKGTGGQGLTDRRFFGFYERMARRLEPSGRLRAGFAMRDGRDIGFILGAVRGPWYRGLQLAYDEEWATYSLGNLLQFGQIEQLCTEGIAFYDLGMDMPYKRSWADRSVTNETLIVWAR